MVRLFAIYKWFTELQQAGHEYKELIDRGVAILLSKFFSNEVKFTFSDNIGRVMKCEIKTKRLFCRFPIFTPRIYRPTEKTYWNRF